VVKKKWSSFKDVFKLIVTDITNHHPGFYGYFYLALIPLCSVIYFIEILVYGENCNEYGSIELVLRTIVDSLYFSVITITTLGYGDITPLSIFGKITSAFESLSGIALIGLFLNALSHRNAQEAQEEERKVMRKELREELVEDFERIAVEVKQSSQEMINQVTGGDSFPVVSFFPKGLNGNDPYFKIHTQGKYPLYDLHVEMLDEISGELRNVSDVDGHYRKLVRDDDRFELSNPETVNFNIRMKARNGTWIQKTVWKKVNGDWLKAERIIRIKPDNEESKEVEELNHIDHNFPLANSPEVDWIAK